MHGLEAIEMLMGFKLKGITEGNEECSFACFHSTASYLLIALLADQSRKQDTM